MKCLVDMGYLLASKCSELSEFGTVYTVGLEKSLIALGQIVNSYDITEIILCFDSPPYRKKELLVEFKANRKPSPFRAKILATSKLFRGLLSSIGASPLEVKGAEADDLIGSLIRLSPKEEVVIVANDSDLHQLYTHNQHISLVGNHNEEMDLQYLLFEYNCTVEELEKVVIALTAITGGHNNLPKPRRGIGRAKASKFHKKGELLREAFTSDEWQCICSNARFARIPYEEIEPHTNEAVEKYLNQPFIETPIDKGLEFLKELDISSYNRDVKILNLLRRPFSNGCK